MKLNTLKQLIHNIILEELATNTTNKNTTQVPPESALPNPNAKKISDLQIKSAKLSDEINKLILQIQPLNRSKASKEAERAGIDKQISDLQGKK